MADIPTNRSLSPSHVSESPGPGVCLLSSAQAEKMAEFFSHLGDPNRLRILSLLAQAESSVGDIATTLGMSQSAVSHQLRILKASRLVTFRRVGRHKFYQLHDHHIVSLYATVTEHLAESEP